MKFYLNFLKKVFPNSYWKKFPDCKEYYESEEIKKALNENDLSKLQKYHMEYLKNKYSVIDWYNKHDKSFIYLHNTDLKYE